jgi:hypothetical protein
MAIIAEIVSMSHSRSEEARSATVDYLIRDDAAATISAGDAIAALPALGTKLTVDGTETTCVGRDVKSVADSIGKVWTGSVTYRYDPVADSATACTTEMSTSVSFVDVFRVGAAWPTSVSSPGNGDIGGTPVDACGEPVSTTVFQTEIVVRAVRDTDSVASVMNVLGRRNSGTFKGFAAGTVLFIGASSSQLDSGKYEVRYRFIYDGASHLRQICARDVDGQPLLNAPDANGNATARHVMARQPFPNTASFSTLGSCMT